MPSEYNEDEYEVVPLTPMRRLEERIRKVEKGSGATDREFVLDIMDLVKANQKLVDEVVKANSALRQDLQSVVSKMDEVLDSWKQFTELLKKAAGDEAMPESMAGKFDKLIDLNQQVLESMQRTQETMETMKSRPHSMPSTSPSPTGISKYPRIRVTR